MNKETSFLYSVGLAGFAKLNWDGSFPMARESWQDDFTHLSSTERTHQGGIFSNPAPYDLNDLTSDDYKMGVRFGNKRFEVNVSLSASNKKQVTREELCNALNNAISSINYMGFRLQADNMQDGENKFVRIKEKSNNIPFFTPIGFTGKFAERVGIQGYIFTEEVKSVKTDFEKESGKSVDVTSGRGIRCVVKEVDKIKGVNLTISMAGQNVPILAMITGAPYDEKNDLLFVKDNPNPPLFAFFYFVKAFSKGENNESSFEKVKVVCFPSCQATLPGDNAQEGAFGTMEITASGSQNKKSRLPLMFYKGLSVDDYKKFVDVM